MVKRHRTLVSGGVAGLILVAVSLLAVLGPATPAQAQINISGAWDFEVLGFGPEAIPCPSIIVQTDATFTIDTECENIGQGTFVGEIDVETGEFTASGDIAGIPIELAGTASQDGELIEGTWDTPFGFSGPLTAVRSGPVQTPTPLPTLPSPVDITGTWRVEFRGIFSGSCDAVIEQTGTELLSIAQCPIIGTTSLTGTLDQVRGEFTLTSSILDLEGVVAADGNSMTGTWSALGFGGGITGERAEDIELLDLSGDWEVVLIGEVSDTCTLEIDQDLISATAILDCEGQATSNLEGTVDPFGRFLSLRETVDDVDTFMSGQLSTDASYIFGTEFVRPVGAFGIPDSARTFIAVPAGALERGIVLAGCELRNVLSNFCFQSLGFDAADTFKTELSVLVAPAGGYTGIEVTLSWSAPLAFGVATPSDQCASASTISVDMSVSLTCSFAEQSEFAGNLVSVTLACTGESFDATLEIDGAGFTGVDPGLGPPTLIGASVRCSGPALLIGPPTPIGDADCSFEVTSIDAALVLQYDAGLLEMLDCLAGADVNRDGNVNSIDAVLILQDVAGLL